MNNNTTMDPESASAMMIRLRLRVLALPLLAMAIGEVAIISGGVEFGCSVGICCDENGICSTWNNDEGCSSLRSSLDSIVTESFFNGIKQGTSSSCAGKNFYTRSAFLDASTSFLQFGTTGSVDVSVREIAALFAHVTHETGSFCYIEELNGASHNYCTETQQWPCNPDKKYYGRGPLQISWNYNYGPAGQSIGFDGLNSPETVANDPVVSFKTAFWLWMNNVHSIITSGRGFGATIRAINSIECDGGNTAAANQRVRYYTEYCQQLGVSPGAHLTC